MDIDKVTIKSYPNGISLYIDKNANFKDVLLEISNKFKKGADFFKDATLVLSIEGRILSIEEERLVLQAIEYNSKLTICSIAGKDEIVERLFENRIKKLQKISSLNQITVKENKIIRGSLSNLQSVESNTTIIVMGNVEKGCSVTSEKDIIILGALYGEAIAGIDKNMDHFIFASLMEPERISIGNYFFECNKKNMKKIKKTPQIAHINDSNLIIEQVDRDLFEENL